MLSTYHALKEIYASQEISLDDLEVLQQYDFIRFENRGISRSERDCLLCEVHCVPLESLLDSIKNTVFGSLEGLRSHIVASGIGLVESVEEAFSTFHSEDKQVEIIASVSEDGQVNIDPDDVEAEPLFQVYLRVQH